MAWRPPGERNIHSGVLAPLVVSTRPPAACGKFHSEETQTRHITRHHDQPASPLSSHSMACPFPLQTGAALGARGRLECGAQRAHETITSHHVSRAQSAQPSTSARQPRWRHRGRWSSREEARGQQNCTREATDGRVSAQRARQRVHGECAEGPQMGQGSGGRLGREKSLRNARWSARARTRSCRLMLVVRVPFGRLSNCRGGWS